MQFRNGIRFLVQCPVVAATEIAAGDLLFIENGKALPASDFTWSTDLETTQADFVAAFLGVAYSSSAAGETDPVSVDISPLAFYEVETTAVINTLASFVGPAEGETGALSNSVLASVASATRAIGRVTKISAGSETRAGVSLASSCFTASSNVNAALG